MILTLYTANPVDHGYKTQRDSKGVTLLVTILFFRAILTENASMLARFLHPN
jgi:hypothetical protein